MRIGGWDIKLLIKKGILIKMIISVIEEKFENWENKIIFGKDSVEMIINKDILKKIPNITPYGGAYIAILSLIIGEIITKIFLKLINF